MGIRFEEITEDIRGKLYEKDVVAFLKQDIPEYVVKLEEIDQKIKKRKCDRNCKEYKTLSQLTDEILKKGQEIEKKCSNKKTLRKIQSYFRESKPDFFYSSEIVEKGYKKIHGYPGDYEMMNYVYNNVECSSSPMGKLWDWYQLDTGYSRAVRGRKNKMIEILLKKINAFLGNKISILNLPCGPARDIKELLECKELRKDLNIKITCVDQDESALDFSRTSITFIPDNVTLDFKKGNILHYVKHPENHQQDLGRFDCVYSIGLADYLPDKLLKNMILFSWGLLGVKGELIYAFKDFDKDPFAPIPPRWFCDWSFMPRSLKESWDLLLSSGISGYEKFPEEWEESGRVGFLRVRKNK